MAGRHYNNNLLDEASSFEYRPDLGKFSPGYHGSNYTHAMARGDDHFMLPMTTGDIHYGATEFGDFTTKMPEMYGFVSPEVALVHRAMGAAKWAAQPHNILPALGMGADYVIPGSGALFDLIDGGLYQLQGQNEMAGLAYGSMFLPVALAGGKRWFGAGVDMATGMPGASKYLGTQMKRPLYAAGDVMSNTYQKGMNVLRGGKPLIDDMSTTAKASLDDIRKLEDDLAMPRFEGELDPMFIGNPNIRMHDMSNLPKNLDEAYNLGYQQTIGFKTGPEAFMRFKHTYPELAGQFKNVGEFDAFIRESLEDITQQGRVQFYDTPFTRSTPWGEGRASGTHYAEGISPYTDASTYGKHRMTTDVGQDILDPRLGNNLSHIGISTVGRNTEQIASTFGHELHHGLTHKIWKENFKLTDDYKAFLKSDDYLHHVEKVKHMPDEFREGYLKHQQNKYINSTYFKSRQPGPWSQDYLMNQARGPGIADLPPETGYPRGIGDIRAQNVEYGNAFGWDTPGGLELSRNIDATNEIWKKRYNYMNRSDEVAARAHEIRMMDDMARARSMEYYSHPWGRYGQDILDYHPDFFKNTDLGYGKSIFDMMYGMAPVGVGLGTMRGVNLLDYASEE